MSLHSLTKSLQPSILHICITSSLFNLLAALARHYRQHCAQRRPPVFNLLRRRFCGFSPRIGDTLHRWGWNLVRRRDRRSRPPRQTSPPSVQRQGCTHSRNKWPKQANFAVDLLHGAYLATAQWLLSPFWATLGYQHGVNNYKVCARN